MFFLLVEVVELHEQLRPVGSFAQSVSPNFENSCEEG